MRKEPYGVGSFVHVVKRGSRGLPIVRDEEDKNRFQLMLTHFNDAYTPLNWYRDLEEAALTSYFERPPKWPERAPLTNLHAFCLLDNHFHLLLEEIQENGIARYMKRLGIGMAKRFNEKYHERGSIFQGAYRAKTVGDDNYLKYVSVYIQVKNAFDMYEGGKSRAYREFDQAYNWAQSSPFSSLGDTVGIRNRGIVAGGMLDALFSSNEYREFAREMLDQREELHKEITSHAYGHFE